jgi:hypothetical protein
VYYNLNILIFNYASQLHRIIVSNNNLIVNDDLEMAWKEVIRACDQGQGMLKIIKYLSQSSLLLDFILDLQSTIWKCEALYQYV